MLLGIGKYNEELILKSFNRGGKKAFEEIYSLFYKELVLYAHSLYKDTDVECEDVIQNIFLSLLERGSFHFDSLAKLKGYFFVAIKYQFRTYCKSKFNTRTISIEDINSEKISNDDYFLLKSVEAEIFSYIPDLYSLLPSNCAETIRLLLEGYSIKDIANKLNKPVTTIYSQREKAISILKKSKNHNLLLLILLLS